MRAATRSKAKKLPLHDAFRMRGFLEYALRDAQTGDIVQRGKAENTVTAWGRGIAMGRMIQGYAASNASGLSAIAFGSVSTAPASNDTVMGGYETIVPFATTAITSATNSAVTFTAAVSFASNQTWTSSTRIGEFALYNSGGTGGGAVMFNHLATATYIDFDSTNTLACTITITN
jgi:hypothetical protein